MRICPGSMLSINMIGMPFVFELFEAHTRAAMLSWLCLGCSIGLYLLHQLD